MSPKKQETIDPRKVDADQRFGLGSVHPDKNGAEWRYCKFGKKIAPEECGGAGMTEINLKIVIPKEVEQSSLVRVILRVIGFAKTLLKRVERGEEV